MFGKTWLIPVKTSSSSLGLPVPGPCLPIRRLVSRRYAASGNNAFLSPRFRWWSDSFASAIFMLQCTIPQRAGIRTMDAALRLVNESLTSPARLSIQVRDRLPCPTLDALRQRRLHELVEVAIEHVGRAGALDPRAQILHQLVGLKDVGADLVTPADLGFRRFGRPPRCRLRDG